MIFKLLFMFTLVLYTYADCPATNYTTANDRCYSCKKTVKAKLSSLLAGINAATKGDKFEVNEVAMCSKLTIENMWKLKHSQSCQYAEADGCYIQSTYLKSADATKPIKFNCTVGKNIPKNLFPGAGLIKSVLPDDLTVTGTWANLTLLLQYKTCFCKKEESQTQFLGLSVHGENDVLTVGCSSKDVLLGKICNILSTGTTFPYLTGYFLYPMISTMISEMVLDDSAISGNLTGLACSNPVETFSKEGMCKSPHYCFEVPLN